MCQQLLEYSLRRGSTDNHSAVLVCFADGSDYARKDHFVAGPYAAWSGDKAFARAYIENARAWGVPEKELRELAKEADRRAPPLRRADGAGMRLVKWVVACYVVYILYQYWWQQTRPRRGASA